MSDTYTDTGYDTIRFRGGYKSKPARWCLRIKSLSIVCSLICNHENQCEDMRFEQKRLTGSYISSIENYISENYFDKLGFRGLKKRPESRYNRLRSCRYNHCGNTCTARIWILRYLNQEKIGGVLRYGIPEFRLPKSILERYKEKLIELGIKIGPNTAIGTTISVDDMFRDGYSAIFIGTGVWKPNTLHIKGETLGNVHYAINYLTNPDVLDLAIRLILSVRVTRQWTLQELL